MEKENCFQEGADRLLVIWFFLTFLSITDLYTHAQENGSLTYEKSEIILGESIGKEN